MAINLINWLLAATPIILFLILMMVFHWGGSRAGALSWLITSVIAALFFGADIYLLGYAYVKTFFLSIDVLLIIWAALFLYRINEKAGTIQYLGISLLKVTDNQAMQAIILGWLFPSFLQGMGGFGVPVAICAPLLVSAGFSPVQAVIMTSLGHGWGVTFGSMASSFQTLMAVTGFSGSELAPDCAILLGISSFFCGLLVTFVADGMRGVKSTFIHVLLLSIILGVGQYVFATNGLWTVAVTLASIIAMVAILVVIKLTGKRSTRDTTVVEKKTASDNSDKHPAIFEAIFPYGFLVILALLINLVAPLKAFLGQVKIYLRFPEIVSKLGDVTPAGPGRTISIFTHPGMIIFTSAMITFLLFRKHNLIKKGDLKEITSRALKGSVSTTIAIFTMVGIATIMTHTQMISILAQGISQAFGDKLFPFISPFIGALGAFITGNNNNSNVLFAALQTKTAEILGLDVPLILAAQTAGGSIGSIMAPAKVIVGCSTVDLAGKEGDVMGKLLPYGLIPLFVIAVVTIIMVVSV